MIISITFVIIVYHCIKIKSQNIIVSIDWLQKHLFRIQTIYLKLIISTVIHSIIQWKIWSGAQQNIIPIIKEITANPWESKKNHCPEPLFCSVYIFAYIFRVRVNFPTPSLFTASNPHLSFQDSHLD